MNFEAWLRAEIRRRFPDANVLTTTRHQNAERDWYEHVIECDDRVLRFAVSASEVYHTRSLYGLYMARLDNLQAQAAA